MKGFNTQAQSTIKQIGDIERRYLEVKELYD